MADIDKTEELDDAETVNPVTMQEWQEYVDGIKDDDDLYAVAQASGTLRFGQKLLDEGYSADDVSAIRRMLAVKMAKDRVAPPTRVGQCQIDYRKMATFDF